jgi:hypothetical protein
VGDSGRLDVRGPGFTGIGGLSSVGFNAPGMGMPRGQASPAIVAVMQAGGRRKWARVSAKVGVFTHVEWRWHSEADARQDSLTREDQNVP